MKSILGLLLVIIFIYALYTLFHLKKPEPEYGEIPAHTIASDIEEQMSEKEVKKEAHLEDFTPEPSKESRYEEEQAEHYTTAEEGTLKSNDSEEGGGIFSGAKDYVLSALEKYEEIFASSKPSGEEESGDMQVFEITNEAEVYEKNDQALLIYEGILGLDESRKGR